MTNKIMKNIKILLSTTFLILLGANFLFAQCICKNVYVWDFEVPDTIQKETTELLIMEIESTMSKQNPCKILTRRNYARLAEHRRNEQGIQNSENLSVYAQKELKDIGADIVIFGKIMAYGNNAILYLSFENLQNGVMLLSDRIIFTIDDLDIKNPNGFQIIEKKINKFINNIVKEGCKGQTKVPEDEEIRFWVGDWLQQEDWGSNGISKGTMTLEIENLSDKTLRGSAYNRNNDLISISGKVIGNSFKGTWYNHKTTKQGHLKFEKNGESSFEGYYELNGSQGKWSGSKHTPKPSYQITLNGVTTDYLNLRTRILSKSELNLMQRNKQYESKIDKETLIEVLNSGQEFEQIEKIGGWLKIRTKYNGKLLQGYISGYYGGGLTYQEIK